MNDIGVVKSGNSLSLLNELCLELIHHLSKAIRRDGQRVVVVTLIIVLRKELLNADPTAQTYLLGEVCHAEASATEGAYNAVPIALK
jgi:hypothetical protein